MMSKHIDLLSSRHFFENSYDQRYLERQIQNIPLFNIQTIDQAEQYIENRLDNSNLLDIARIFYGYTRSQINILRKNKQIGGQLTIAEFKLYTLLSIADSVHDFKDLAYTNEELEDYLPNELSIKDITSIHPKRGDIPVFNEDMFIEALSKYSHLTFLDNTGDKFLEPISNPLYKINIKPYPIEQKTKNSDISYEDLYTRYKQTLVAKENITDNRNLSLEIWSFLEDTDQEHKNKKRNRIELSQIANICRTVREVYKNYNNGIYEFQLDNQSNDLIKLIVAVKLLNSAFHKKFSLYDSDKLSQTTIEILAAISIEYQNIYGETIWNLTNSDASIYDPGQIDNKILLDLRPTGPIYNEQLGYQITLGGVNIDQTINIDFQPDINIESHLIKIYSNKLCVAITSIENLASYINKNTFINKPSNDINIIERRQFIPYSKEFKLALKRAGDWGQIMHARRYKKIFVTSDRLAALFAAYNSVPYILFKEDYYDEEVEYNRPSLLQAAFIIGY